MTGARACRKMVVNRVQLTPFSAPPELPGSPEVNSATAGAEEMFTRRVVFPIKVYPSAESTRIVEGDILPLLYAQSAYGV